MNPRKEREKIVLISEKMQDPDKQNQMYKEYQDYLDIVEKNPVIDKVISNTADPNIDILEDSTVESKKEVIQNESRAIPEQARESLEPAEADENSATPQKMEDASSSTSKDVLEKSPPENEFQPPSHT